MAAQYIYVDICSYSGNHRSVEAQVYIVDKLNEIIRDAVGNAGIDDEHRIFSPAGDAISIAIIRLESLENLESTYDLHLTIALDALKRIAIHNQSCDDEAKRFEIRIGLNQNTDNIIRDINGRANLAGFGINRAYAIMSAASASQIFVSQTVYDTLRRREAYMDASFRALHRAIKHGEGVDVYQFIGRQEYPGLNTALPSYEKPPEPGKMPILLAYYLAMSKLYDSELRRCLADSSSIEKTAAIVYLYLSALDARKLDEATNSFDRPILYINPSNGRSVAEYISYLCKSDIWVMDCLEDYIIESLGLNRADLLQANLLLTKSAWKVLRDDWPGLAKSILRKRRSHAAPSAEQVGQGASGMIGG